MNKMKPAVAVLTDNLKGHGGEETVLKMFSKYLSDSFRIEMIVPYFGGNKDWFDLFKNNNNVIYCNRRQSKLYKYMFVAKLLLKTKSDILICMTPQLMYFASVIRKLFNKHYKIISWQHFSIFRPTDKSSLSDKENWKEK